MRRKLDFLLLEAIDSALDAGLPVVADRILAALEVLASETKDGRCRDRAYMRIVTRSKGRGGMFTQKRPGRWTHSTGRRRHPHAASPLLWPEDMQCLK
ncbi:hypothetical protein [Piscinibacter sp.]|uniref:hypothetical protein n=1 Tax=Piscinibacter sp. TaxID=1903157 RepID=UPI002CD4DC47|nr:hypothetical protein [Albitalea sp.]HUG25495.1 hypothetical protein [Albitalea sp.]